MASRVGHSRRFVHVAPKSIHLGPTSPWITECVKLCFGNHLRLGLKVLLSMSPLIVKVSKQRFFRILKLLQQKRLEKRESVLKSTSESGLRQTLESGVKPTPL